MSDTEKFLRSELGVAKEDLYLLRGCARALVEALPQCDDCDTPATKAQGRGGARWCDEHAPKGCPDYPRAEALRDLVEMLATLERGHCD